MVFFPSSPSSLKPPFSYVFSPLTRLYSIHCSSKRARRIVPLSTLEEAIYKTNEQEIPLNSGLVERKTTSTAGSINISTLIDFIYSYTKVSLLLTG